MREEIRDRQAFSRALMVFCRSDKDRRDASDGATFVLDARYRIQEDASRIKDKGKKDKGGRCRQWQENKRQEASDKQSLSRASMVFCRSDKGRRDALDGATFGRLLRLKTSFPMTPARLSPTIQASEKEVVFTNVPHYQNHSYVLRADQLYRLFISFLPDVY